MNQALSQIKQKDISALQHKKSPIVENCIKACNILTGDKKKYPDAKTMIAAFSQKASFVLDLVNANSFEPKATDGVFCKQACVWLKAAVSIDRG